MTITDREHRRAPSVAKALRVLVVEDSAVQRGMLMALLNGDPGLEVVGWACNGADSVGAAASLKPDVITMDLRMPVMDGLEATRRIMQETPTPIVIVTASVSREDRRLAVEAFRAGALALVAKPAAGPAGAVGARELLRTIKGMAGLKVIRRLPAERLPGPMAPPETPRDAPRVTRVPEIVAIGASTGGPQALLEMLALLPADFALPILVVQHIAPGFVGAMVDWLKPQCPVPLQLAVAGRRLDASGIHIAPSGHHLVVNGRALALSGAPPLSGHRPSATVLFQSVARVYGAAAIGVVLSGMAEDGVAGLGDLKRAGATTISQDEASSTVFGMPAAAIDAGVVDYVLPPAKITPLLVELAQRVSQNERGSR